MDSIDSFFDFVHHPVVYKQITLFLELDMLPSLGDRYLLRWVH